jgi:uncharacterized protein involved in exopolysaccharide biosynthesis
VNPIRNDEAELDALERSSVGLNGEEDVGAPSFAGMILRLWERRAKIKRGAYVGLLLSTVAAFLIPPTFESTARIMPPDKQGTSALSLLAGSVDDKLGALAADTLSLKSTGAIFAAILQSRTVQDRLVQRFDLKTVYKRSLLQDTRDELAANTDVNEDRKSGVISVTVKDHSPDRAQQLAAAYVEELNRLSSQLSTSAARREREFLEIRLATIKKDLADSSKALAQFSSKTATFDPKEQGKATMEEGAKIQAAIIAAQAQVSGLEQIYSSNNIRVRSLRARIAEMEKQLNNLSGRGEMDAPSGYPALRELPSLGVAYYDLYRNVRMEEAVFEVLTKQYELAKVQEAKEVPTVRVMDDANFPEVKSFPKRGLLILLGTALACFLSAIGLMVEDRWNALSIENPIRLVAMDARAGLGNDLGAISHRFKRLLRRPSSSA